MEDGRKLTIHKSTQDGVTLLRLVGTLDEQFDGAQVASSIEGTLVVSLGQVRRITSFGIRQWMDFLDAVNGQCQNIYLVECTPRVVDQLNMVANFAGPAHVVSFYAPYRCEYCGTEEQQLIQLDGHPVTLEPTPCPNDNRPMVLDDDPATYLSFVNSQPPFELSPQVAAILAGRTQYDLPDAMRHIRIEKRVRDRFTILKLSGDIGEDFPATKLAEGLEGDVVFDLAAVSRITDLGRLQWQSMMRLIAPTTERILVLGMPTCFIEIIEREPDLAQKGQVLTLFLPYFCEACSVTSHIELDALASAQAFGTAKAPEVKCPDCGGETQTTASPLVRAKLRQFAAPDTTIDTAKLKEWSRTADKKDQAVPRAATTAAAPIAGSLLAKGTLALLGVAVVALIAIVVALVLLLGRTSGKDDVPAATKTIEVVESSLPKVPAWRDQVFWREGSHVAFTGPSGFVQDKSHGFERARAAAIERLCQQIALSIRDPRWMQHVGNQYQAFRAKLLADLEKALVSSDPEQIKELQNKVFARHALVAKAFSEGPVAFIRPTRSDSYWEKLRTPAGIRYRVWAAFHLSKEEYRRLVEAYGRPFEALDAVAVSYFPSLAWRYNLTQGAVIIGLRNKSPLRHLGIQPGDLLLNAQDRTISDGPSFQRILSQEHDALSKVGGALLLRTKRGEAPAIANRLTVLRASRKVRPHSKTRRPPHKGGKRLPPANIWDDNPFE